MKRELAPLREDIAKFSDKVGMLDGQVAALDSQVAVLDSQVAALDKWVNAVQSSYAQTGHLAAIVESYPFLLSGLHQLNTDLEPFPWIGLGDAPGSCAICVG